VNRYIQVTLLILSAASLGAAAEDDAKLLPDGAGKDTVVKVCLSCHGTGNIRKLRLSSDDWSDKVAEMVERGAKVTESESDAVVGYLAANFGERSKVQVNTAPLAELRSVLGFSPDESKAVIAWRQDNGAFKEWRDLLKVPGLDAGKVEAKKDLIVF
jgi:competence ComEA-like helix-hairpin-helix protein